MQVGKILKEYRRKKNITQTDLGKMIGVNKQTISKWENDITSPSIYKIYEISGAIGIDVKELLHENNCPGKQYHFYKKKLKLDIGLNSLLYSIHDFDSLFFLLIPSMPFATIYGRQVNILVIC